MAVGGWVYPLKVAAAVGIVERHAVLVEIDAAQMVVTRQTGTTNGQSGAAAPFGLGKNASSEIEHVLDGGGGRVAPLAAGDQAGRRRNLGQAAALPGRRGRRAALN